MRAGHGTASEVSGAEERAAPECTSDGMVAVSAAADLGARWRIHAVLACIVLPALVLRPRFVGTNRPPTTRRSPEGVRLRRPTPSTAPLAVRTDFPGRFATGGGLHTMQLV